MYGKIEKKNKIDIKILQGSVLRYIMSVSVLIMLTVFGKQMIFLIFNNFLYSMQTRRNSAKSNKISTQFQTTKKMSKDVQKGSPKSRVKKSNEITASTLGSRSSMDSKLTKRRDHSNQLYRETQSQFGKTRESYRNERHHKNAKKFVIPLEQNRGSFISQTQINEGMISFREYCMIGDKWIPILTPTQRQRLTSPFKQKQNKTQKQQTNPFLLQQRQKPLMSTLNNLKKQIDQSVEDWQQMNEQTKNYYYQVLKNAMFKLHSKSNEEDEQCGIVDAFQGRSSLRVKKVRSFKSDQLQVSGQLIERNDGNKENFELCENMDSRVKQTQKQNKQIPISQQNIQPIDLHLCLKDLQNSPVKKFNPQPYTQPQAPSSPVPSGTTTPIPTYPIQQLIKFRQLKQMGIIIPNQKTQQQLDTSIVYIDQYLKSLFMVIRQGNYVSQIVMNLKIAWGCPKKQKLAKIRGRKYLGSTSTVMPQCLFQYVEDYLDHNCFFSFIHNKCIFDYVNHELDKLKPFYDSNGQVFPWNFKLNSPLTFYQIDQNCLSIAFDQIKTKIFQSCSMLCGLIVQINPTQQNSFLQRRRTQRQDVMCNKYLSYQQYRSSQENWMENQATLIMENIGEIVFNQLLAQIAWIL